MLASRIVAGQYLSAKPPLTLDDFVAHWALAAQETARGYLSSRSEFQGDLLVRDALSRIGEESPPDVRVALDQALKPWDELFLARTIRVEAGSAGADEWWGRLPREAPGFSESGKD